MDQRHIDVFVAIMRLGSVTAAAESMSMSQPSVSKIIALTERRLGFALFERVKGRLEPTPEANLVFDEAIRLQENVSRFERFLVNVKDFHEGQLRVAATPALSVSLLPKVARQFREKHPHYGLVVDMQLNHEIVQHVENGEYDLGFLVIPSGEETKEMELMHTGQIVCVAPKSRGFEDVKTIDWEFLKDEQVIHITTDKRIISRMMSRIPDFSKRVSSSLETNRYSIAVKLVAENLGVTLVDDFTMMGMKRKKVIAKRFTPHVGVSLVAVLAKRHSKLRAASIFMELLKNVSGSQQQMFYKELDANED